jgi:hypothetical protein
MLHPVGEFVLLPFRHVAGKQESMIETRVQFLRQGSCQRLRKTFEKDLTDSMPVKVVVRPAKRGSMALHQQLSRT